MHFGRPRAKTEPTSPSEGGRFNSELPNTERHRLEKQVQSVGPSSPITVLGRFRLHTWPTVSTHLCQRKVKNRGECGRDHLPVAWRWEKHSEHVAGLVFLWEEYCRDCTLGLLFRLDLPVGYLLGAYTDGAYLLGGGFIRGQLSLPPRR